ncbi:unnamed protein product [Arabidopsis halleri]
MIYWSSSSMDCLSLKCWFSMDRLYVRNPLLISSGNVVMQRRPKYLRPVMSKKNILTLTLIQHLPSFL